MNKVPDTFFMALRLCLFARWTKRLSQLRGRSLVDIFSWPKCNNFYCETLDSQNNSGTGNPKTS